MTEHPTPKSIAAELTVPERLLLFCLASNADWVQCGRDPRHRTVMVCGLIECEEETIFRLTDDGDAVLAALLTQG